MTDVIYGSLPTPNDIKGTLATEEKMSGNLATVFAKDGKSAYEVAVKNGFEGTETEWLASLQGEQGIQGIQGEKGDKGDKGDTGEQGIQGEKGDKGDKGDTGEQGIQGIQGKQGEKGDKGDAFTYSDFTSAQLASLKGEKGDKGDKGNTGEKGDTGNSGVYLGSGDMPDDCNVQIDPNGDVAEIVQTTGDSETVVMSQKAVTDIAKRVGGINLFTGAYEIGALSTEDGSLIEGKYYCTEFIPVKQGYYYYDTSGGFVSELGFGAGVICFYDENKNFIRRTNYSRTFSKYPEGTVYTSKFKAPSDGFVRYQISSSKFDKLFFFESTETITTIYEMPDFSFSLQARLGSIENKINDLSDEVSAVSGTDVLGRNENALFNLNAASKYGYHKNGKENQEKRFTALITTDVHSDDDRLKNAIEILNKAPSIDCGFCLGDIQGSNFAENDGSWYTNIVNVSEKPFYTILGNHDQKNYSANSTILVGTGGTPSEAFDKFIQPTLSVLGQDVTMPYYKVLNDTYKIAILCLNNYDIPIDKNEDGTFIIPRDGECISTEQLEWFINELNTIPTDYHLIIARHSFPNENECIDDKWSQTRSLGGSVKVYEDNNIIPDIVNAWINGTSLSKSYAPISGYELCPTHNVNVDFTSRGQGNFVCYLVGHSHADRICSSTLYENQIIVGFCATTADFANNYCSDLPRVRGTRSEDAITAVTVDTTERKIRLVRFGSDITFDLIKRDVTTVDY